MGKLEEFNITFDNNKEVYRPGEYICGTVTVKVGSGRELQCKAIRVNCNGFCGITDKLFETAWMVKELYFNFNILERATLKQGEHTFPFKFLIPATAPASFEGIYGRVIYRVRAFIDTSRFLKNYETEKPFYLRSCLNLNELPDIWGTCSSVMTHELKKGTVVLGAHTNMKGYTPRQTIQVTASIHNQTGEDTGNMKAALIQRVTYETKRPTHDIRTVMEVEGGVVKAGKEVEWKEQITVPPLPHSPLTGCELIKIEYYVKVSLKSPDIMVTLPIHIGSVPLNKIESPSKKEAPALNEDTPLSPSAAPADNLHSEEVPPNTHSYAPGLFFSQNQHLNRPAAVTLGYAGQTPLNLPLHDGTPAYPNEAPPSYDEVCNK